MRQLGNLGVIVGCVAASACGPEVSSQGGAIVAEGAATLLSTVTPNNPYFSDQWQLHNDGAFTTKDGKGKIVGGDHAHVADAWALIMDLGLASSISDIGKDVRLAVIDDGFDLAHEEIKSKVVASKNFGGVVESGNLFSNSSPSNYHGMLVTGIAAAAADNGKGISGVCPGCKLVLARIDGDGGASQNLKVEDYYDSFFDWVLAQDAHVINASWGPDKAASEARMQAILDRINDTGRDGLGTALVFASGNSGEDFAWNHFADSDDTLSVGGTDSKGARYDFSNFGAGLDVMAPTSGAEKQSSGFGNTYTDRIWSTDNYLKPACLDPGETPASGCSDTAGWNPTKPAAGGDGWVGMYSYRFSHTSAAAPVVSGVLGLMLHVNPQLTSAELRQIVRATADKVSIGAAAYDAQGFSTHYGHGRVNALRAVAFAHLYGGGELSDDLRADIDAHSPCTRTDCWDLSGAPAVIPTPEPEDDAGAGGSTGGTGGTTTTGGTTDPANTGGDMTGGSSASNGDSMGASDAGTDTGAAGEPEPSEAGSSGCSTSATTHSGSFALYALCAALGVWLRKRRFGAR